MKSKSSKRPGSTKLKRRKPVQCSALLAADVLFLVWCVGLVSGVKEMLDSDKRQNFEANQMPVLEKLNGLYKATIRQKAANDPDQRPGAKT